MTEIRNRKCSVQVNDRVVDGLRVSFKIEKGLYRSVPNSIVVKVYNLSQATREHLDALSRERARETPVQVGSVRQRKRVYLSLTAGYEGLMCQLFKGDVRRIKSTVESPDIITHVTAGEGEASLITARVNRSFARNTQPSVVARYIAEQLGVELGNAATMLQGIRLGAMTRYANGAVLSGNAARAMDVLCTSAGLEWSVQNNALQLTRVREAVSDAVVLLSPSTGMIGSPTRDDHRLIKGKCFIQPDVLPGRLVRVESKFINATIRVEKVTFSGDTHGPDWFIDFEGRPPLPPMGQRVIPP